jgi:AraC family transcriptional regulator, regulatory protein of adaptative response / methylated-DNA-[protein]-cysteine methyltransferase
MSEKICYAWGESSLGSFLAAVSDRGLVAFEFADDHAARLDALRARLPEANVDEDVEGLADVVSKLADVVDHPERDPQIALDARGTAYATRVWDIVREIPAGQVKTYGEIAARMGTPRDARDVTEAIANNTLAIVIPCHRVVKKDGSISGYRWGTKRKRALLNRETRT